VSVMVLEAGCGLFRDLRFQPTYRFGGQYT
jgi:hypothetical protein